MAIDIGTSSLKVGLFNRNLQMLTTHIAEYSYHSFGMCFQIEPEKVWKAFLKVMEPLRDYLSKVELVVPCVFSPALIALDEDGKPHVVPPVIPESELEKRLHETAPERAKLRQERRDRSKALAKEISFNNSN